MRKPAYHEPHPLTRREVESAFASGDPERIAQALVNITFHEADWRRVQEHCLRFARSDVAAVRQIAVTCLGHLARIHGRIDLERVLPVLNELARDPQIQVEDALDDIRMFAAD